MSHNTQAETERDRYLAFSIFTKVKFCLQVLSLSIVCLLALGPKEVDRFSQEKMLS